MPRKGPDMAKLLAKIAKVTQTDEKELKEIAEKGKDLYSYDEAVMQRQAIINFFEYWVAPEEPRQKQGETKTAFAKRKADYENARNEWKFEICKGCGEQFVYAYHYRGVKHCSLECLDASLRKIGLELTIGRDLRRRWGHYGPAIVPADALETLKRLYGHAFSSHDADVPLSQPKSPVPHSQEHESDNHLAQDTDDNISQPA